MTKHKKCALFIDCENINSSYITQILKNLHQKYKIKIKRAYADWSLPSSWKQEILDVASIEPIQVFHRGYKNSCDIKICLDALELAYTSKIKIFAIATNDSDFRHLIHKLKQRNIKIIGFGTEQASSDYKELYHKFYVLKASPSAPNTKTAQTTLAPSNKTLNAILDKYKTHKTPSNRTLNEVLLEIILPMSCMSDEYISANQITQYLQKNGQESWRIKNTGFKNWASLFKNVADIFEHRLAGANKSNLQIKLRNEIKQLAKQFKAQTP